MSRIPSREEMLFADVLAQPPAERDAFLAKACGADAQLLARIAGLIAAHDGPAEPFDSAMALRRATPEEKPGDWIGRYRLLQKIGEGGCGVVWMAEQQEPVRRRVALKIIKLGMDTQQVIARFEAERQALALMDHPNIAKVLDGGASDSGRPYFVMELVRGVPITAFCDDQNLPTLGRLELFIKVCHAIQHAHQKGIIHRDIKPSNVLVTLHDDEAVPMVIDFGIAKATQGRLTDQTLFTAFDQFLGTPVYMSPEQAEYNALDVDTRSDIYSLGVLLYELLTGRPPFDPKTLREAGIEQIRRIIRETEPPRPSTRIRTLADEERTTVAKRRSTGPGQLLTILRGDLDWIVLKALEKNRTRRYQTATALADDISRYLRHELVLARPPSLAYRARKFIRRNRLAFAASVIVATTLAVSTVVSASQAMRAREAERAASLDRRKVLEEQARAEKVIAYMIGELRTQLAKLGRLDVMEGAANQSMAYFASLNPNDVNDATLTRHAQALLGIGQLRMDQAEYQKAQAASREAYARAVTLAGRNPKDFEIVYVLTRAAYLNGFVHWRRGEFNEAQEWFLRQQDAANRLIALNPDDSRGPRQLITAQHNLAGIDVEHGELQRAKETFLAELALLNKLSAAAPKEIVLKQQIASVIGFLGMIAERLGDLPEAGRWYAEHASLLETFTQLNPDDVQDRFKLADTLFSHRAEIFAITGDIARARETLARAREIMEKLVAHEPANHWWRLGLFTVQLRETILATAAGPRERAEQLVDATRKAFLQLTAKEPSDRRWTVRISLAWRFEAEWRHAAGAPDAAAAAARAIEMGEKAIRPDRVNLAETAECAQARIVAGRIAAALGDAAGARSHWHRADELLAPLVVGSRNWRLLDPAARVAAFLGRHAEAGRIIAELNQLGYVPLQPWPDLPLSL